MRSGTVRSACEHMEEREVVGAGHCEAPSKTLQLLNLAKTATSKLVDASLPFVQALIRAEGDCMSKRSLRGTAGDLHAMAFMVGLISQCDHA